MPIGELRPYTDLDDLVRNGDWEWIHSWGEWAIEGLKTLAPDKAIPFKVAVEKGQEVALRSKAVEALAENGANQHSGRVGFDIIKPSEKGGTSARFTNTATGAWRSPAL